MEDNTPNQRRGLGCIRQFTLVPEEKLFCLGNMVLGIVSRGSLWSNRTQLLNNGVMVGTDFQEKTKEQA